VSFASWLRWPLVRKRSNAPCQSRRRVSPSRRR
jgi:hypothetical protein